MLAKLKAFYARWADEKKYETASREPFYAVAGRYLPESESALIVDLGCGNAEFARKLNLASRYKNLNLLDGNQDTIESLSREYGNAHFYRAPGKMPFGDGTVDFLHCSHMIEHLYHEDLYQLLIEINRVLKRDGILVVSAPLYWPGFYNDMSHIRPYPPCIFRSYLCPGDDARNSRTREIITTAYREVECKYRWGRIPLNVGAGFSSDVFLLNLCLQTTKKMLKIFRVYNKLCTGYTLVLKKN